jgi:hypothetical protein
MACLMTNHPLVLRPFSGRSAAPFRSKNPAAFLADVLGPKTSSRSRSLQLCLQKSLVVCCSAPSSDSQLQPFDITLLEHYTQRVPSEILLVHAIVDDEEDKVLVYKVFKHFTFHLILWKSVTYTFSCWLIDSDFRAILLHWWELHRQI